MKKFIVVMLFAFSVIHIAHAQLVTLTFTAKYNNSHIDLDSIYIQNLTQGGSIMLYYPDTVFVLGPSSVSENHGFSGLYVKPAYPNPFEFSSNIEIFISKQEKVVLRAFDLTGKQMSAYESSLPRGWHSFSFVSGNNTMSLMSVETNSGKELLKMVGTGTSEGTAYITYNGMNADRFFHRELQTFFPWDMGDNLRYTGFATIDPNTPGTSTIESDPIFDATMTFYIQRGISCVEEPFVTDIDGNVYQTVRIGDQCWMAENLRTSKYSNFDDVPFAGNAAEWAALTGPGHCWFNYGMFVNDSAFYAETYGLLYNWYAVDPASNGNRNICPDGWHVPSHSEWLTMVNHLGGSNVAGGKLKESGTLYWNAPNTGATNETGFSALPSGVRNPDGGYADFLGTNGHWWTTSPYNTDNGLFSGMGHATSSILLSNMNKKLGMAIRCVRD